MTEKLTIEQRLYEAKHQVLMIIREQGSSAHSRKVLALLSDWQQAEKERKSS